MRSEANVFGFRPLSVWLAALAFFLAGIAYAADTGPDPLPKEIRIGYQKFGTLILLKSKGDLERRLAPLGVSVAWAEFQFGPPMLEALNAGSIDFATTGETPPVFGQAARGSQLVYVGYESPSPEGEAIIVPKDSNISSVADLKGRRVAVAKGSNSHYLLVRALAKAGLGLKDIQVSYLAPADARAAFERGAVDAWSIWDFYLAAAQETLGARILVDGKGLVDNHEIYTSRRGFAERYPELVKIVLEEIAKIDDWTRDHPAEAAEFLSSQVGVASNVIELALKRRKYGLNGVSPQLVEAQQKIADTLHAIGLVPQPIRVADAAWMFN
ncbi:sulfonate ABC transporter substrate-binding protein [Methylocaldum szegediense]|uniref:Aliphatic sulfonate ABC transporter periplasmic binding protein n=1 Tax=Methylocaldum szegediense TaxID=73780 RepID=A0ABM9I583_9GAMM|nr:sulfonate ABC transporter substrate-binding protein [Methylocaldum szegediense]CAI8896835.1 aliphatic sulfonate ABC transporter periplasmic binding protein [Methylocaldum szegediense]